MTPYTLLSTFCHALRIAGSMYGMPITRKTSFSVGASTASFVVSSRMPCIANLMFLRLRARMQRSRWNHELPVSPTTAGPYPCLCFCFCPRTRVSFRVRVLTCK